jgi:hypothetical protein
MFNILNSHILCIYKMYFIIHLAYVLKFIVYEVIIIIIYKLLLLFINYYYYL